MKVYKVGTNSDVYQSFLHDYTEKELSTVFSFDGTPKRDVWKQPKGLYIANPMDEKGNFFHLGCQVAMDSKAYTVLKGILETSCELLPFTFEGEQYYCMNVLNTIDCYDLEKGEYDFDMDYGKNKDGLRFIFKYAFNLNNFNTKSLFKDDLYCVETFTYEGFLSDPEKEFKYRYEKHNLKGLKFRLLWDSEKEV